MQIWLLALASSVLLSIPYIVPHCGLVSLVAFVPLFLAEQLAHNSGKKRFFHIAYVSFLVWNLITTFWVWFATPGGAMAAFILNTLQMAIIFSMFRWMRKFTNGFLPYIFFCIVWLAWEHSYQNGQINWPWLVLGNSFATSIKNIQWYEFTGVLGGSLWVLLSNMLLVRIILLKNRKQPQLKRKINQTCHNLQSGICLFFELLFKRTYQPNPKVSRNTITGTVF